MVISTLAEEDVPVLGVCLISRKIESVERFQRNWTKLFQVVEVWIELVLGLSEIAKRNPCFPDGRFWTVSGLRTKPETDFDTGHKHVSAPTENSCQELYAASLCESLEPDDNSQEDVE